MPNFGCDSHDRKKEKEKKKRKKKGLQYVGIVKCPRKDTTEH